MELLSNELTCHPLAGVYEIEASLFPLFSWQLLPEISVQLDFRNWDAASSWGPRISGRLLERGQETQLKNLAPIFYGAWIHGLSQS